MNSKHRITGQAGSYSKCGDCRYYFVYDILGSHGSKYEVFWNVAPCSHVEVDLRFRGAYCL
jgi:hypothetical protein